MLNPARTSLPSSERRKYFSRHYFGGIITEKIIMGCKSAKLWDLRRKVEVGILDENDGNNSAMESPEVDMLGKHRSSDYIYCCSLSHVENEFRLRETYVPNRIICRHLVDLMEEDVVFSLPRALTA